MAEGYQGTAVGLIPRSQLLVPLCMHPYLLEILDPRGGPRVQRIRAEANGQLCFSTSSPVQLFPQHFPMCSSVRARRTVRQRMLDPGRSGPPARWGITDRCPIELVNRPVATGPNCYPHTFSV